MVNHHYRDLSVGSQRCHKEASQHSEALSLYCGHFCRSVDAMWTLILKIPFNQQFKHLTFPLLEGLTFITVN